MSTILITGGTGTFGNAVVERYLKNYHRIRIFSRDEKKQEDMRIRLNNPRVEFFIGDVRDAASLVAPMEGVDYVFHAAALKQVPSSEFFPLEAVKTNILGAENVFNAAINAGVGKVVALSTDKAVYPINAMGISKAMMERVMTAKSRTSSHTVFCGTRYGNVLASRGSVVPLFIDQIKSGKPLTVTNPDMTRFMMTIEEAVELVKYAFEHGQQGDMFVKKSPAATVLTVANAIKEILNSDAEIKTIGTRHGEKLFETLVTSEEMSHAQDHGNYYRLPADTRDLNYASYFSEGKAADAGSYTSHNTYRMNLEETVALLKDWV
ncbi:MAG: SDR family NAD(P)-dependent oxidoreductase [Halobacteriota archaeon]|jgi:UDP-glucose 4-epimerase